MSDRMQLTLENLIHVAGGEVAVAFDECLKRVVHDLNDRSGVSKSRVVTISLEMKPITDEHGDLASVSGVFTFSEKIPGRSSTPCNFGITRMGHLSFSPFSAEDADQCSLPIDGK